MEDKTIPGFFHEADMARMERSIRRAWIIAVIAVILMFLTNAFWIYEWCSYDEVITDVEIDGGDGIASYIDAEDINGDVSNAQN